MGGIEIVSTGAEPLEKDRCKAILVLRLGAALNTVRALQRWTHDKEHPQTLAGDRDLFQSYLIAGAYLAEACKLFWKNQSCILELARKGEAAEGTIAGMVSVADPDTGVQASLLKRIRDKATFHWDCEVFEGWASAQRGTVVWLRGIGDTDAQYVMWASHEAVSDFTADLNADKTKPVQDRINDQVRQVLDAMNHVTHVFESAVAGFLKEHGAKREVEEGDSLAGAR